MTISSPTAFTTQEVRIMTRGQPDWLGGMEYRLLGPYRGGRVTTVVGHPTEPMTFFFGGAGGGVWKTDDGGALWRAIADPYLKTASVGSMAISASTPRIMVVGMGENVGVQFHSYGDGVYKTVDSGRTWQNIGLSEVHNVGRVKIHPTNPDLIYVAALGHRFGPNPHRGVYRTQDGGETWQHILFRSPNAGAVDLTIDETNPDILYAAFWEFRQQPWTHWSGGPDSGIYRSTDGGDTWEDLTRRPGLPPGVMGKCALAASPVKSGRVWAMIESHEGGIYRSEDYGLNWTWLSNERNFLVRPHYQTAILADTVDANTVYVPSRKLWKSTDGGRTFAQLNVPYVDQHDLWVDSKNPRRMILGNDGGASVSFDGGRSWSTLLNQPTAEIYRVTADNHFPYRVYGSQQDNSTLAMPSRSERSHLSQQEWYDVGGGESGYIAVRPDDPDIVYSSDLPGLGVTRYDHRTHQLREIGPWNEAGGWTSAEQRYRFNWSVPVKISPHDPKTLYVAGNVLFRSRDEGETWQAISPDLTRQDPATMVEVGGPISKESSSAYWYPALSSVAESPLEPGVIWAGSDDGLIHVTRDGGETWANVTPPGMPTYALIRMEVSRFEPGNAYAAATNYRLDDFAPYLFKTDDYGATWHRITVGIPDGHFTRILREDSERAGLLFVGTEVGVYASLNDGASWFPLKLNLPAVIVYDLCVKEDDLIVATHGRSIWSLDNISPLRAWSEDIRDHDSYLFWPQPVIRLTRQVYGIDTLLALYNPYVSWNAPAGITVDYYLAQPPKGEVAVQLLDKDGHVLQHITSMEAPAQAERRPVGALSYRLVGGARLSGKVQGEEEFGLKWGPLTLTGESAEPVTRKAGINRTYLPLLTETSYITPGLVGRTFPPILPPGEYTVRLLVDHAGDGNPTVHEVQVRVDKDPRVETTQAEYEAQYALLTNIRDHITRIHQTMTSVYQLRAQLQDRLSLLNSPEEPTAALREQAAAMLNTLYAVEHTLIQPGFNTGSGELDYMHFPEKLDGKLMELSYQIARSDNAPTAASRAFYDHLVGEIEAEFTRLGTVFTDDVPAFNALCHQHDFPIVRVNWQKE